MLPRARIRWIAERRSDKQWLGVCLALAAVLWPLAEHSAQQRMPAASPPIFTDATIKALMERPTVKAALKHLDEDYDRMVQDLVTITEIPAPPFKEQARAKYFAERLRDLGLRSVQVDDEGNAIGERPGGNGPTLVVAAHLDTVFPEGTDTRVKKKGTIYSAPGIGDDTHGLAVMLALARALDAAAVRTRGNIVFVGDVGEEGLGNLRGVRYLFEKSPLRRRIDMFISMDGTGDSVVTNGGVASKRYRVTFRGPGGHSYGAFGLVNPAYAMANTVARFSRLRVPSSPKTTFNVGTYGGGTSVNSIPVSVWMEVDMRSESVVELAKLEQQFLAAVRRGVEEENRARRTEHGSVMAEARLVGERKGGQTPAHAPIVQAALAVTRVMGRIPTLRYGSTDSNIPISMNIPAITIGSGGNGGRAHSLDEWSDVDKAGTLPGMQRALVLILALVGVE